VVAKVAGQEFKSESVYSIMLVADGENPDKTRVLVLTDRENGN
jgi:hypothetical protein